MSNQDSKTDVALTCSEQELRSVVETIPALVWRAGSHGNLEYANKRVLDYLGATLDEIIGWGWMEKVHPDDIAFKTRTWLANLESRAAHDAVCRFRGADGQYRWFEVRGEPLRASDGAVLSWYGVLIDIDNQRKSEEALRESEEGKLRQIIETVPAFLWSTGPDGEPTHINQRTLDFGGMRLENFQRGGWEAFMHPADFPETAKAFCHAIQTGTSYHAVHRLRRADGEYRWHHARGEPLRDRDGRIIQWYGLSVDIDEGKKAEARLHRSEAYLAEAQRLSHTGSAAYNETEILYWSEEASRIWGFDPLPAVPSREAVWQRIHPDDLDRVNENIEQGVREKRRFANEFRILLPDRTVKHLEATNNPVFSESGELLEIVVTGVDVTERKRVEERLRVQHTVAQILAEAVTIEEATPRILRAMGECLGWDVGALWRVDRKAEALRCVELWHKASIEVPEFEKVSREYTFGPGLGLPGRVWSSLEPEYIADVVPDENFPRAPIAEREELHAALAFPILFGGEALGVIEFFSREIRQPDQELLNVLAAIGSQIGQFIERKRGEEALRESETKFRDYAETASDWFCEIGPDYKFTMLSENAFGSGAADRIGTACWDHALDLETEPEKWRLLQETVFARKPFRDFVYRGMSSNGSPMYVRASGKPLFDANGEFRGYRGTCSDVTEIMRAQEALRESERRSRSAIDGIAGLVAIFAPNGELDSLNRQVIDYFGRSLEEMKNWGTSDAIDPEDLPRIAELFQRSMATGTPFHYELRLRRFDGEYRWFDNRCVPIRDNSGRIVRWYMLGTDIEDRKRAEEALRDSEAKFRDYAETASDWFWEIDPDYKYTMLTENAFGSNSEDRIGSKYWDHALDLKTESEKWQLVWATLDARKPFRDFVYCAVGGNGSPMHVRASGKPVFDAREFRGYRGTGTDVTGIISAQEALRESERSSRSAIDGIAGLVAILAPNGAVETVNRQCLEYFGRSLADLENWQIREVVHPEDRPRTLELFKRAIISGIPFNHELRMRRSDGEYRWFENRGVPIRDDSGRIGRWYVLLTDVEDRTRALAQLEQMQSDFAHMNRVSMMGELAASLSHEITQPIAAARNYARAAANFLDQQPPDLGQVKKQLGSVVSAVDRSGEIIERIRDQTKKTPPRKAHFNLNQAIDEVIALARSAITQNGVSVQTVLAEGLAPVQGDRVQLQQVVLNLILNAVEAMGSVEGGPRELLISTEQTQAKEVLVAVRDSGPGIDPENLERVFEAFYTTKTSGMGMGLSICRSIIDAHGGRLWAGVNEPRGGVFQFTLPDAEKDVTAHS